MVNWEDEHGDGGAQGQKICLSAAFCIDGGGLGDAGSEREKQRQYVSYVTDCSLAIDQRW